VEVDAHERRAHAYENPRPDVQHHVPRDARRILDLGCASGALGAALKARQPAEVTGVEHDPLYAARAEDVLDRVIPADLEELFASPAAADRLGEFDCIIAADVLEHLRDPWSVLAGAVRHLAPGGRAIVSLPNIRYWNTFWAVGVRGTWPRIEFGIFDSTHLRFFTLRDARALIEGAGLRVEDVDPQYRLWPIAQPLKHPGPLRLWPFSPFFAFQYVITAAAPGAAPA
jgi:methionine biosynthesis protein MetW